MIYLVKGEVSEIILTLKEKQTLTSPNYLFYFKSRGTNIEVKFVLLNNADTSTHKDRYNSFDIPANTYFDNLGDGEFDYKIYEQTSTTNTNPALATSLLESGIMRLTTVNNALQVDVYNEDYNAEPTEMLLVDNLPWNGYLSNNPDNTYVLPTDPDNSFISNNPDNTYIVNG